MKDIRPALRYFLLADSTISTLVGGVRIHTVRLPQGQREPSIVYNRISEGADYTNDGDSGLSQARFQIDAWATRQDSAVELANAIYDRLTGHRGTVEFGSGSPQDSIEFRAAFLQQGREDYDSAAELYRMSRDFTIWYAAR